MAKQSLRSSATITNSQTRRRTACALIALTIVSTNASFAQLTLPYSGSGANTTQLFQITQNGTGITAQFLLNNNTTFQPALLGQSISPTGTGVLGRASATSGTTNGVYGWADSPSGRGVFGTATATSGFSFGVWGQSSSPAGTGVYGVALSPSGSTYGGRFEAGSFDGTGVYGVAVATSGVNYGVVGRTNSPNGYGGYFVGRGYFSGDVGIGTNAPSARLHIEYNSNSLSSATLRLHETESDFARLEFTNTNASRRWHIAGLIGATQSLDRLNFWNSIAGDIMSISGNGTVGIGTTNPSYRLHVETNTGGPAIFGDHTATSGTAYGVYGLSASTSGTGVYGRATATSGTPQGVSGVSDSTDGTGVFGYATATSGATYGVHGVSASTAGTGVYGEATATSGVNYGVYGRSASASGTGVYGRATATSGTTNGVHGQSDGPGGRGVFGEATATSGVNYGVYGRSASTSGTGVLGRASATSGAAWGVWGRTLSSDSNAYGVYGEEPSGGAGHAVYADGTLAATGTKLFQIDHPLRPETHYLNHFCTEAPEPINAYSGTITTDAQGYAVVQLPDYFEAINRDFRYQLTVIDASDDFVQAKVVRKIQNNQFVIRTSKPFVEVSWEVKAVRNDPWVQRYGFQTEQEKEDAIKGKYLNPELYGQPKERGI
ncbi:MAG: hypothetical protein WHS44_12925, partial [Fimbriimonadales bacterium]